MFSPIYIDLKIHSNYVYAHMCVCARVYVSVSEDALGVQKWVSDPYQLQVVVWYPSGPGNLTQVPYESSLSS